MDLMSEEEVESYIDHLYSEAEDKNANAELRLAALQEYIDQEEHEINQLQTQASHLSAEAAILETELRLGTWSSVQT